MAQRSTNNRFLAISTETQAILSWARTSPVVYVAGRPRNPPRRTTSRARRHTTASGSTRFRRSADTQPPASTRDLTSVSEDQGEASTEKGKYAHEHKILFFDETGKPSKWRRFPSNLPFDEFLEKEVRPRSALFGETSAKCGNGCELVLHAIKAATKTGDPQPSRCGLKDCASRRAALLQKREHDAEKTETASAGLSEVGVQDFTAGTSVPAFSAVPVGDWSERLVPICSSTSGENLNVLYHDQEGAAVAAGQLTTNVDTMPGV